MIGRKVLKKEKNTYVPEVQQVSILHFEQSNVKSKYSINFILGKKTRCSTGLNGKTNSNTNDDLNGNAKMTSPTSVRMLSLSFFSSIFWSKKISKWMFYLIFLWEHDRSRTFELIFPFQKRYRCCFTRLQSINNEEMSSRIILHKHCNERRR